jgi:hypothetical protein
VRNRKKKGKKIKNKIKKEHVSYRRNKTIKSKITKVMIVACLSNRRSMEHGAWSMEHGAKLNK